MGNPGPYAQLNVMYFWLALHDTLGPRFPQNLLRPVVEFGPVQGLQFKSLTAKYT